MYDWHVLKIMKRLKSPRSQTESMLTNALNSYEVRIALCNPLFESVGYCKM